MEVVLIALLFILGAFVCEVDSKSLDGFKLVSVFAKSKKEVEFLYQLEKDFEEVDFWTGPVLFHPSTVLLPPHLLHDVETNMTREGIGWKEQDSDVQQIVQDGMKKTPIPSSPRKVRWAYDSDVIDHTNYHSYGEIVSSLRELKVKYPLNVDISEMRFPTHEGRAVVMVKIHSAKDIIQKRPSILIEAGIHAREWISPAATLFSIEKFLKKYHKGDSTAQLMLDSYDWYVVPVANPDGYEFTQSGDFFDRLWRKNRRLKKWDCNGVDLNRNFDVYFGTTGVSSKCWSMIYPGEKAFSEPETANIEELFLSIKDNLNAYISVHAYSQYLLVPWSFSNLGLKPENAQELLRVARKMARAINETHGKIYEVGTVWDLLEYAASGSSTDWAIYQKPNIYSFAYELRPDSTDFRGFNLPPDQIVPTGEELLASLEVLAKEMKPVD